ncbi:hypothetical protein HLB44_29225 [Aquincola sp. S2]|uniref:Uncharacterized protein n=1 Tax=Pseudaquabacterium terrae TaxID=2732868 RepID=A0ABX2ER27_9BURK|nr:hypothetical protein [Aquabacterium terrae]NRF71091.1 hypothetical protein [Aquabacterium terrae]
MSDKDLERTQCLGVIGSMLIAAVIVALALPDAPGDAPPSAPAGPVVLTSAAR